MIKRRALNKLLGGKLVKPVSSVAKSANQMLDTEHEYLTYLRNRKKFFFMTQVQQTKVVLGKKGKKDPEQQVGGGGGGLPLIRRRRRRPTKKQLRAKQKGTRVGRFMRNTRAAGLRAGRRNRGVGKAFNNINKTGQRIGTKVRGAPGRVVAGAKGAAKSVAGGVQRGATALMPKATNVKPATLPKVSLPKPKVNMPKVSLPKVKLPGVKGGPGPLSVLFAGLDFAGRKAGGQTNLQAGVGAGAGAAGSLAGGAAGAALGTLLFPGVGTAIGGWIGSTIGASLAAGAADMITGANKPQQEDVPDWVKENRKRKNEGGKTSAGYTTNFDLDTQQGYINGKPVSPEEYDAFMSMSEAQRTATYGNPVTETLADGGVVKSPTRALIGEGGEPEVVLPQSKLGEGYQNMLKSTGGMLVGFASNFLNTIPVGGAAIGALRGEVSRLKGVFGGFANVGAAKIFSGGKVPDMMSKIGSTLTGLVGGAMNMVMGPAYAGPMMPPPPTTAPPAISGSATAGTSGQWGPLLDLIAGKESGGNYEAMYPSTTMPGMTQMTITQVINKATGAVGKYQQLPRFLAERARRAGLDPDKDLFSPANQDKIILEVNIKGNRQGDDWLAGKITDEQFMQGLSQEFASMPNAQGKFHYPGQSSAMTPGQVMDALRRVKNAPKGIQGPTGTNKTMTPGSAGVTSGDLTPTPASITGAGETNGGMVSGFPITSPYGPRVHPVTGEVGKLHGGIDVGTPTGTPLALNAPGEILAAGNYGGYGFMQDVWIPSHNIQLRLAHLSEFVKRSGQFAAGEVISKTGGAAGTPGAGSSSGPHLHFEADTRKNSGAYGGSGNPAAYAKLIALGQGKASTPTDDKGGVAPVNKEKNLSPVGGVSKQPSIIPIPMPVPQAQPMPVQVSVPVPDPRASKHKSYGINPFSGRYEVL